ncbi:sugar phosphate nucleotidyltransferase [Neobacillus bataviensis]|uniref:sugar phosphate nucleotidyltransferase n=1 Tax=Neobacillus bataviensis TaxID=220685 RepID=UPI001CBAACCA|nr:sugar phosphate nucleotidyltransferase [Neobacillus bataviensis]
MKGVILCAGKGTRMQPFSSSVPKTLLPVANQPILNDCIIKMKKAGITEIGIVMNPGQKEIINYISFFHKELKIQYIYQTEQLGLAHALSQAESFISNDSFILMLGDNIILEPLETLIQAFKGNNGAILLTEVKNGSDFGIAEIKNHQVISLEEKPKHPKSNLAVIGMYIFDGSIFDAIRNISLSKRGEYEITDAIQWMINHDYSISYSITKEPFSDVGTIGRWLAANEWVLSKMLGDKVQVGSNTILENCTIEGPVLIGNNCILKNAKIGPYISIQDDSSLINCMVEHSILLKNTKIMNVSPLLSNSIFGINTKLIGINEEIRNLQFILGSFSQIKNSSDFNEEGK